MRVRRLFHSCINYIKITYFLAKIIFKSYPVPKDILKLISEYIRIECPFYECTKIVKSRDVQKSSMLLSNLINSYVETSSEVTLNQILDVLKEEFLKRGNK